MAEIRFPVVEPTKIRNVPIAVTPEGFWCCPSPVAFQRTLKPESKLNKAKDPPSPPPPPPTKPSSVHAKHSSPSEKKLTQEQIQMKPVKFDDQKGSKNADSAGSKPPPPVSERLPRAKAEALPRKVSVEFGEPGTSDLKAMLIGKHGFSVKLNVHKEVLVRSSRYFAEKLSGADGQEDSYIEISDCEDVEIFVETVGLMYCKDLKQRLVKQSVQRVLCILKVAESIGFSSCIQSCLVYIEAVPWVGEEEEDRVVSSVMRLQREGLTVNSILKRVSSSASNSPPRDTLTTVNSILKRVSSSASNLPPRDTLTHIIELVLKSTEERARREMKSVVLKLLKENSSTTASTSSSGSTNSLPSGSDLCQETIYNYCKSCLDSLLTEFKQASSEPDLLERPIAIREPLMKQIALEADNVLWLLEMLLADGRGAGDRFVVLWVSQKELASLHSKLPAVARHHVSCITAWLFVGIGRGEMLPCKRTRHTLLRMWLKPLINDYGWLSHGCRSFDRAVVEEGIGRTILTLPLEDQHSVMLDWMVRFLKQGDSCPDLRRAFEVWWRRAFVRPYSDRLRKNQGRLDQLMALEGID